MLIDHGAAIRGIHEELLLLRKLLTGRLSPLRVAAACVPPCLVGGSTPDIIYKTIHSGDGREDSNLLTVNSCIKVRLDLQADKSPVVVKGPFFPRVVNPRYRIRGTMCNAMIQSSKARKAI
jgi:hypothetical protein